MGFWTKCFVVAVSSWITLFLLSRDDPNIYPALLHNKNVIITGASSGLGEQAAYYAAKLGANVVIAARREELLKEVISKCKELSSNPGAKFKYFVADFSEPETCKSVITEAASFLGSIDYLILNHAYLLTNTDEISEWIGSDEQHRLIQYSMNVNFVSYVHMSDQALPILRKSNGSLTVISSMIVEHPAFSLPYAASKSALNAFYTGLRQELIVKKENVSVTVMHLGFIQTESSKKSLTSMVASSKQEHDKLMSIFPPTSASEGGQEIIQAAARRDAYVYFPRVQRLWLLRAARALLRDPDAFEQVLERWLLSYADLKIRFGF